MSLARDTSAFDERVGLRVKIARKRAGLSQEKLGAELGVTFQQVQKYEKGRNRVPIARLQYVATRCGVPLTALLDDPATPEAEMPSSLVTSENMDLLRAFDRIASPIQRRRLISLAEAMAEPSPEAEAR